MNPPSGSSTETDSFALRWQVVAGELRIGTRFDGATYVIALAGDLDLTNASTLATELQRSDRTEAEKVIVDMRELEFIDSTGVAVLVTAWRRAEEQGRELMLVPSRLESVRKVFDLTGLNARLPLAPEPPPS